MIKLTTNGCYNEYGKLEECDKRFILMRLFNIDLVDNRYEEYLTSSPKNTSYNRFYKNLCVNKIDVMLNGVRRFIYLNCDNATDSILHTWCFSHLKHEFYNLENNGFIKTKHYVYNPMLGIIFFIHQNVLVFKHSNGRYSYDRQLFNISVTEIEARADKVLRSSFLYRLYI